jgi:signal transduction histidine kinase/CheY-like chemotaxis protein
MPGSSTKTALYNGVATVLNIVANGCLIVVLRTETTLGRVSTDQNQNRFIHNMSNLFRTPIILLLLIDGRLTAQQYEIFGEPDSLRQVWVKARPEEKNRAYFSLGLSLQMIGNDSVRRYGEALKAQYARSPDPQVLGFAEELLATYFSLCRQYDVSAEHFRQSATAYATSGDRGRQLQVSQNLSFLLTNLNRLGEASKVQYEAYQLAIAEKDTVTMIEMLHQLGMVQARQKLFTEALRATREAYRIEEVFHKTHYYSYAGFAKIYENQPDKLDSARLFYQKAFEAARQGQMTRQLEIERVNLARIDLREKKYPDAYQKLQQAYPYLSTHPEEKLMLTKWYLLLANAELGLGRYPQALAATDRSLELLGNRPDFIIRADLHQARALIFAQLGDYAAAYRETLAGKSAADSVVVRERAGMVADITAQYRNSALQTTIVEQNLQLERTRARNRLLLAGSLLLLLLGGVVTYVLRQKRRQAELELRLRAVETNRLRELDQIKSNFFANISHEFRTPLTLILSPLRDLRDGRFKGEPMRTYATMERNAERLLALVNQLLDLSRLESGKLTLLPEANDLAAHLRLIAGSFESLAAHRQIEFSCTLPTTADWRHYDRDKLEQIVVNLLGNAFKFTKEEGEVSFGWQAAPNGDTRLIVYDKGIGIPASELPRIFERFYRVENQEADGLPGSGIGLALTKELVTLMGGTLAVRSVENQHTAFTVTLPLPPIPAPVTPPVAEARPLPSTPDPSATVPARHPVGKVSTVLLAEDNPDLRAYLTEQLRDNYIVMEAANGRLALEIAQKETPDLLITDLMMPEMDGIALTQHIKADVRTSHIPVVMLTAKAERNDLLTGIQTGAEAYLNKPVDSEYLHTVVANLLRQRSVLFEKFSQEVRLGISALPEKPSLDQQWLREVLTAIEINMEDEYFGVEQLADKLAMSRSNLFRKLNALTGKNPNVLLRELRLARAKQLLEQGAGNVSEVSLMVGFSSRTYFAKCFAEHYGVPPSGV